MGIAPLQYFFTENLLLKLPEENSASRVAKWNKRVGGDGGGAADAAGTRGVSNLQIGN